jgi:hypothetical protein
MNYRFVKKWNENVDVKWWKESRIELNKIIQEFNDWQIEDDLDPKKIKKLLAKIEYGKQTIGSQDGGSGYMNELRYMEEYVKQITEE